MSDEIKVTVCKYPDRENLVLRYADPVTGKQKTKSARTPDESEATRAAGKWEDDLRTGRYQTSSKMTWTDFRKRFETETQAGYRPAAKETTQSRLTLWKRL